MHKGGERENSYGKRFFRLEAVEKSGNITAGEYPLHFKSPKTCEQNTEKGLKNITKNLPKHRDNRGCLQIGRNERVLVKHILFTDHQGVMLNRDAQ